MREVVERPSDVTPDAREALEPMLDDLARGLGYERALVLVHDPPSATLRGLFGRNVRDELARSLVIPLTRADDPLVIALRAGVPQLVDNVAMDERLDQTERELLLGMKITRCVAASLPGTGNERTSAVVILGRDGPIADADLERLLPFARQAGAALTREHDVELLRRASESHAIE